MDDNITEMKYDAHIAVLNTKVESLLDKQKELTERVRANEKVVAALGLLGTITIAFIGAGYFVPKANAMPGTDTNGAAANEWVQKMKDWKVKQHWTPPVSTVNNAIEDLDSESEPKEELFVRDDDGMRIWNRIFRTK